MYAVMLLPSIVLVRVVTPTTTRQDRRAKWIIQSRWRDLTIDDLSQHDGRLSPAVRSDGEG